MKCNKCQHIMPDDSSFCQYCGSPLAVKQVLGEEPDAVPTVPVNDLSESQGQIRVADTVAEKESISAVQPNHSANHTISEIPKMLKTAYCKKCGGQIDSVTKKCKKCGKQYFSAKKLPIIITSVLSCVFVLLSAFLLASNIVLYEKTEELESTIQALNDELAEKNSEAKSLQSKANYYDDILKALRTGSIGRASNSFSASDSVILVNKNTTDRKFTLYTTWSEGGGTISIDHAGSSAVASFDNNSWYDSTTLTVIPKKEGITAVTFSNDLNADTFTVLIIVVP